MFNLRFLAAVLWQRRWFFVAAFAISMGAAVMLIISLPQKFTAEALIAVDTRPLRSVPALLSGQDAPTRIDPTVLAGEMNLLTSRSMLEALVAAAGLPQDPEFATDVGRSARLVRAAQWVRGQLGLPSEPETDGPPTIAEIARRAAQLLTVEVPRGSSQIRVSFQSMDAAKAARIVDTLVSLYLTEQRVAKQRVATQAIDELRQRVAEQQTQATEAAAAAQAFRDEHRLLRTVGGSLLSQQLNELVLAEQRARIESEEANARLALVNSLGPRASEAAALLSAANQEVLARLAAQEAEARSRLSREMGTRGPLHPAVLEARAQLGQINDQLSAFHAATLVGLRNAATAIAGRQTYLASTLEATRVALTRENALEARLEQLTAEARIRQAAYEQGMAALNRVLVFERDIQPDMRILYSAGAAGVPSGMKLSLAAVSVPMSLLIALAAALATHLWVNSRRQTAREFEELNGIPIVGICPSIPGLGTGKGPLNYLGRDPLSEYAESVRGVRNGIDFDASKPTSIAVTSAMLGEGKSTLAVSLATAWSAAGVRTLLIDCDTRRPSLPRMLRSSDGGGLTDFLSSTPRQDVLVQKNAALGFDFILAGSTVNGASYRFTRSMMSRLVNEFVGQYDKIILDLPPVLSVADAAVGAAASDLVLFVNHWGRTKPDDTRAALDILRRIGAREIRAVLCRVDQKSYAKLASVNQYASYAWSAA